MSRILGLLVVLMMTGCGGRKALLDDLRTSPEPARRAEAAARLGQLKISEEAKQKEVVDALIVASCDPDEQVQEKAIEALGEIGTPEARQALLDIIQGKGYTTAALQAYRRADQMDSDTPEVLIALAKSQLDLGRLKDAENGFRDAWKLIRQLEPYQQSQHLTMLKYNLDNLRMRYEAEGEAQGQDRVASLISSVDERIEENNASGAGGFGGPGGFSFPPM